MSIRKIRANKAEIEGDYVKIETYSQRSAAFITALISFSIIYIVTFTASPEYDNHFLGIIIVIGISTIIATLAPGRILRDIPLVDLVEIKRYQGRDKVTVVLDDERVKRGQQNKKG